MKAISVFSGKPNSVHLADLNKPSVDDVPNGRGILVKVLRVGADGTDKRSMQRNTGPLLRDLISLVIGNEGFGQVEAVGPNVTEVGPGDYVVATVRRPGRSIYDLTGTNDMTTDDTYLRARNQSASSCRTRTHNPPVNSRVVHERARVLSMT